MCYTMDMNKIRHWLFKLLVGETDRHIINKCLIGLRWMLWDIQEEGRVSQYTIERINGKLRVDQIEHIMDKWTWLFF